MNTIITILLCVIVCLLLPDAGIALVCSVALYKCVVALYRWFTTRVLPLEVQLQARELVDAVDLGDDLDDEQKAAVKLSSAAGRRARRTRYLPILVREIKAEKGLLKDTAANRMVLRKLIFIHATDHGIRPTHIQEFVDLAISMILTPTANDIEAAQHERTNAVQGKWSEFIAWGGRIASLQGGPSKRTGIDIKYSPDRYPSISENRKSTPHLVVRRANGKSSKPKEIHVIDGIGPSLGYNVFNASFASLMVGINERLFFVKSDGEFQSPPKPLAGVYYDRLSSVRKALLKNCSRTHPIPLELYPGLYQGRKRTNYEAAVESLRSFSLTVRDAIVATFTKVEKVAFDLKKVNIPRIIQPRNARYLVSVGRYIKAAEHILVKAVGRVWGDETIVKGMNADQVGQLAARKWGRFRHPVAVGMDASRFDQHVSRQALEWEHGIYIDLFASRKERRELGGMLKWQLDNVGRAFIDGYRVDYKVDGCRMSGDPNTGIGNCVLASCLTRAFVESVGLDCDLLNNGDDCVLFLETEDLHKLTTLPEWFTEMGFTMIVEEPEYELERVEFCQSRFILGPDGYRQVRNPRIAVAKDGVSIKPFHKPSDMRSWFAAIGEGGASLTSGIPVMQEYYQMLIRNANGAKAMSADEPTLNTGTRFLAMGMESKVMPISPSSRYSFWLATGIMPEAQEELERHYSNVVIPDKCADPGTPPIMGLF